MKVVIMKKDSFVVAEYASVTNIAYNAGTKVATITYGSSQTASYDLDDYLISILW